MDNLSNTIDFTSVLNKTNTSYSGTDCVVVAIVNGTMLIIGNLLTLSYSTFREKTPVRVLGHTYPKGFTYGSRSIAGSLVFVTFDEHPLYPLFQFFNDRTSSEHRFTSPISDDIPPIDLMLVFSNEYGSNSILRIYGVEMFQEGGVYSINDMYSETTIQYIAKDIDPMISQGNEGSWKNLLFNKMTQGKVINPYMASLLSYKQKLEATASGLMNQITSLNTTRTKPSSFLSNLGIVSVVKYYTTTIKNNQTTVSQINKLNLQLKQTTDEIHRVDNQISNNDKLTADMNYAVDSSPNDNPYPDQFTMKI